MKQRFFKKYWVFENDKKFKGTLIESAFFFSSVFSCFFLGFGLILFIEKQTKKVC